MSFTDVFGGNTIYPASPTFSELALTEDTTLQWPLEQNMGETESIAAIIEVTPDAAGLSIIFPDARMGSKGYVTTLYNAGGETFTVKNAIGGTILTVASGEAWNVYLRVNTTEAGAWRIFQMGAGTSFANAAALAGAGLVANGSKLDETMLYSPHAVDYAIILEDKATVIAWTGGAGNITLPDAADMGANWFVWVKNIGNGSVTITPTSGTIDAGASLLLSTLESCAIVSDGTNYFTIGFGQESNSVFDFISINAAGTGDLTLAGAQLNRVAYEFTGLLTGNRNIIVPTSVQQYWVYNNTTGAFNLTVKTAAGTGVIIAPGTRVILFCDGTNVVNANDSSSLSLPILVSQGGTGATDAATARTNLGATAIGSTLFTAANATAALAAIASAGNGITITGTAIATDTGGNAPGYLDVPQNVQGANYTLALADRGKHVYTANSGITYTIPANGTVAFPVGSAICLVNNSAGNITIARAGSVVLYFADGVDANRTLGSRGMATVLKVDTNTWFISGSGIS